MGSMQNQQRWGSLLVNLGLLLLILIWTIPTLVRCYIINLNYLEFRIGLINNRITSV